MKKDKKVIVKSVCLKCITDIEKQMNRKHDVVIAGMDFECEWCEELISKYQKYAQFYKIKGEKLVKE